MLAALLIANSPLAPQYGAVPLATGEIRIGSIEPAKVVEEGRHGVAARAADGYRTAAAR
jgi:hypothetical protein